MYCAHCGSQIKEGAKFCPNCGTAVKQAAAGPGNLVPPAGFEPAAPTPMPPAPGVPQQRGCFSQAFDDAMGDLAVVARVAFVPAAIALVSIVVMTIPVIGPLLGVIGIVVATVASVCATGYAIQWGREAAAPFGFNKTDSPINTKAFSLGMFGGCVQGVMALVATLPVIVVMIVALVGVFASAATYSYTWYRGSSPSAAALASLGSMGFVVLLAFIATVVLAFFCTMFGDSAVVRMAARNKVDEALDLKALWAGFHNKTKLFCASILPGWVFGIAGAIINWIIMAIFGGGVASLMYSLSRSSGAYAQDGFTGAGAGIIVGLALTAFVSLFIAALTSAVKYRAVSYWVARYNPSWLQR